MPCSDCAQWITCEARIYEDGSEITDFQAPVGQGRCEVLKITTGEAFGCTSHAPGNGHIKLTQRPGAPWQHSKAGPCPDCFGAGNDNDRGCKRCAGTGKVRHYEDGYIGEEQTRLHPKEREMAGAKPKCASCQREVEPSWKVCPSCAHKLDAASETEHVDTVL